jgi:hypothetical protein
MIGAEVAKPFLDQRPWNHFLDVIYRNGSQEGHAIGVSRIVLGCSNRARRNLGHTPIPAGVIPSRVDALS